MTENKCAGCGLPVTYHGRGRPRRWHPECRAEEIAAKQAAYYEKHREEIAAKKAAYREKHREEIAAKQAAYREKHREEIAAKQAAYREKHREKIAAKRRERLPHCQICDERLRSPSDDGLCGFCREELAVAA